MANAITVVTRNTWDDGKRLHVVGTIALSGSYAAGGEVLNWGAVPQVKSTRDPIWAQFEGKAGFVYQYDKPNDKLMVSGQEPTSATAGVIALSELAAGAYPAGITGDSIQFYAVFEKFI